MDKIEAFISQAATRNVEEAANLSLDDSPSEQHTELLLQPTGTFKGISHLRPVRDVIFALAFLASLLAFTLTGLTLAFRYDHYTSANFWFSFFAGSIRVFVTVFILELVFASVWLYAFQKTARPSIWAAVILTPILLAVAGIIIIAMTVSERSDCYADGNGSSCQTPSISMLLFIGSMSIILSAVLATAAYALRRSIHTCIRILQLACTVLRDQPTLLGVGVGGSVLMAAFGVIWLYLFSWLFFLGDEVDGVYQNLSGSALVAVAYFVLMFFWTSSLLHYMSKYVISGVAAHWYFHRNDPARNRQNPTLMFLWYACSSSLGSLALAALVLGTVQFMRFIVNHILRRVTGTSKVFACCCSGLLSLLEAIIDKVSAYSVARMAITGDSFCDSTGTVVAALRRVHFAYAATNVFAATLLSAWNVAFALLCGALALAIGTAITGNMVVTWTTVLFAMGVGYLIMGVITSVLVAIADALLVCHLTDREVRKGQPGASDPENDDVNNAFAEEAAAKTLDQSVLQDPFFV